MTSSRPLRAPSVIPLVLAAAGLVSPASAETVTFTFSGTITVRGGTVAPPPFGGAAVGDAWSLTYTFDTTATDVYGEETAGSYYDLVSDMTLTIGSETVTGAPGAWVPGPFESHVAVNLTTAPPPDGYADYVAEVGLAEPVEAWAWISLSDDDSPVLSSDDVPVTLPTPLSTYFPDIRSFEIRDVVAGAMYLHGTISAFETDWTDEPASGTLKGARATFEASAVEDGVRLDLLVDSATFGPQGFASGFMTCVGCKVMGVEPSPFKWLVDPEAADPPAEGEAALTFLGTSGSDVMGPDTLPSVPLLVAVEGEVIGELDLDGATGTFGGPLGALTVEGARVLMDDGTTVEIASFEVYDDGGPVLGDVETGFLVTEGSDLTQVDLLVDAALYGEHGFATGMLECPGCEVMGVEPSPWIWMVDPESPDLPADGEAAISFVDRTGSGVMGPDTLPSRTFLLVAGGEVLGEVDFDEAQGTLGSFHLEGVRIAVADDSYIEVEAFESAYGVDIDIKPGSEDNVVNLGSSGVIPVAILSSDTFDATLVDPETVRLAGASVRLAGRSGRYLSHEEDVDGDGYDDLVCQVLTEELLIEVGASTVVLEATTDDGTDVRGTDSVVIVPD